MFIPLCMGHSPGLNIIACEARKNRGNEIQTLASTYQMIQRQAPIANVTTSQLPVAHRQPVRVDVVPTAISQVIPGIVRSNESVNNISINRYTLLFVPTRVEIVNYAY